MEGSSTINTRRLQGQANYALVEIAIELAVAGCQSLKRGLAGLVAAQRRAQARGELHALSDRTLKDIGLERADIDGMFR